MTIKVKQVEVQKHAWEEEFERSRESQRKEEEVKEDEVAGEGVLRNRGQTEVMPYLFFSLFFSRFLPPSFLKLIKYLAAARDPCRSAIMIDAWAGVQQLALKHMRSSYTSYRCHTH